MVHDGVMFLYGYDDVIQALNAETGDLLWQYSRQEKQSPYPKLRKAIAIYAQRVYSLTSDGHVVALDIETGNIVWDVRPTDAQGHEFWFTSGPLIANSKVIFGTGGSQPGGNFVLALDAQTGKELWRFATIPEPGMPEGDSWNDVLHKKRTGGGVWTPGNYDPELNLVFFGPAPTYDTAPLRNRVSDRKFTNDAVYTNATLALDADTGKLAWFYSHFPNDQWDLDRAFER